MKKKKVNWAFWILIALIVIVIAFFIFRVGFRATMYAIFPDLSIELPSVSDGSEVFERGYKFSNTSGVIVSTKPVIRCKWKPDDKDDGWKRCEAIFEINNKGVSRPKIRDPEIKFDFESKDVRNVTVSYSDDYTVAFEKPIRSLGLTGRVVTDESENDKALERDLARRTFGNFREFSSDDVSSSDSNVVTSGSISGRVISQEGGFDEGNYINTKKPFAIRVEFEIPKYASNQFNFEISENSFVAKIDPDVSECGELDETGTYTLGNNVASPDTCFTVTSRDVVLDCANNEIGFSSQDSGYGVYSEMDGTKILNCQIKKLNESVLWSYGIYLSRSDGNEVSGNSVYARGKIGTTEVGIYLDSSNKNLVHDNHLSINGSSSSGFYVISSINNSFNSNILDIISDQEGYGFYSDSDSKNNLFNKNSISLSGNKVYAGLLSSVSDFTISNNTLHLSGSEGYGFYLEESPRINILSNSIMSNAHKGSCLEIYQESSGSTIKKNNITSSSKNSPLIYLYESNSLNISGNDLSSSGEGAYPISLYTSTGCEVSRNNIHSLGSNSAAILGRENSDNNNFISNTIITEGINSNGISLAKPGNVLISNNFISTLGDYSQGINVTLGDVVDILQNNLSIESENCSGISLTGNAFNVIGNEINSIGASSWAIVFPSETEQNNVSLNRINVLGEFSSGVRLMEVFNSEFWRNTIKTLGVESYGFYLRDSHYNNIYSNEVTGQESDSAAIYLRSSIRNTIERNNFSSTGINSIGISLTDGSNKSVLNENTILIGGSEAHGIYLTDTSDCYSYKNIIRAIGNEVGKGIYLGSNSKANVFDSDEISSSGRYGDGIFVEGAEDNNFTATKIDVSGEEADGVQFSSISLSNRFDDLRITSADADGIYLSDGAHDFSFYDCQVSSSLNDFYVDNSVGGEWNFISSNLTKTYLDPSFNGVLNIFWYLDVAVEDESGVGISRANVTSFDIFGDVAGSALTDADGIANTLTLLQYSQDNSGTTTYELYLVNVTLEDGRYGNESVNMTADKGIIFTFLENSYSTGGGRKIQPGAESCDAVWKCSAWSECIRGIQTRDCINEKPECTVGKRKPIVARPCGPGKKDNLFDVQLELLDDVIYPGRDLTASVALINVGRPGITDTTVYYGIDDSAGNVVYEDTEQISLETQVEYLKDFDTTRFNEGEYTILVDLSYEGQQAPAQALSRFTVSRAFFSPGSPGSKVFAWGIILLVVLVVLVAARRKTKVFLEDAVASESEKVYELDDDSDIGPVSKPGKS